MGSGGKALCILNFGTEAVVSIKLQRQITAAVGGGNIIITDLLRNALPQYLNHHCFQ
jgi:hypothetical protein